MCLNTVPIWWHSSGTLWYLWRKALLGDEPEVYIRVLFPIPSQPSSLWRYEPAATCSFCWMFPSTVDLSSEITSRTHLLSFRLRLVVYLATVMRKTINVCFGSSSLPLWLQLLYQKNVEKHTNRDVINMKAKNIKSWRGAIHPSCCFLGHLESHIRIHTVNLHSGHEPELNLQDRFGATCVDWPFSPSSHCHWGST